MRTNVTRVGLRNSAVASAGDVRLGVMMLLPGPPPRLKIAVMPGGTYEMVLGGTFPIGDETWRFADASFLPGDRFTVTVERIDPPSGADLRPFGPLGEEQVAGVESALGRRLPPVYRSWLARTNGVQPVGEHGIPGMWFALFEQRPLLGVHPTYPPFDLAHAEVAYRRGWLPASYVVIAVPVGGLIAVRTTEPDPAGAHPPEMVVLLPEPAMTGQMSDAADAARALHLRPLAVDIEDFLPRLQPLPAPE